MPDDISRANINGVSHERMGISSGAAVAGRWVKRVEDPECPAQVDSTRREQAGRAGGRRDFPNLCKNRISWRRPGILRATVHPEAY